jgi:serine/threonine-protein kinase
LTDLRTELQTALATAYSLERELGRGGMATVSLAQDLRHDRPVALKVLHPDLARTLGPLPISREAYVGAYTQHQLVRIYLLAGEPEKALDRLEPFLKIPYYLSPVWLRIDPTFAPLAGNPRFERLIAGG